MIFPVIGTGCVLTYFFRCKISQSLAEATKKAATKFFYMGYKNLNPNLAVKRRDELFEKYNTEELPCQNSNGKQIDAVYISSSSKQTGNVLVVCLNKTYQAHHPKHWEPFLENGADIVLWNPTKLGGSSLLPRSFMCS
jgi:hypothetical protein